MSKYIPKVGEAFEWYGELTELWRRESEVIAATKKTIAFINQDDVIQTLYTDSKFRPIPTKADVEREQLGNIINQNVSWENVVKEIQKAGFTIPKKVKRSEIADVVANTSPMISVEDLVDEICNLLGDLVEDG